MRQLSQDKKGSIKKRFTVWSLTILHVRGTLDMKKKSELMSKIPHIVQIFDSLSTIQLI